MSTPHPPTVLVGTDGSASAEHALDWAAQEAGLRGARLHIATLLDPAAHRHAAAYRSDLPGQLRNSAQRVLSSAAARVQADHPGLETTTELVDAEPVEGLLRLADRADLLVVGSRGLNTFLSVLLGSVSYALAAHAEIPMVLVHGEPRGQTVVVGMAPDEPSAPVEFAFAEAQRRSAPLLAVRTWMSPQVFPGVMDMAPDDEAERHRKETDALEADLAAVRKAYPEVEVTEQVGLAIPEEALVEASLNAALVVLGRRVNRPRLALPLGRVTHRVVHHSHAPVAVVAG